MNMNIKDIGSETVAYIHSYRIKTGKKNLKEAIEGICKEHQEMKK